MNKKRLLCAVALVVVLAMSMALLVACGGSDAGLGEKSEFYPENFVPVDYSTMQVVEGMDSFDLLCEVYDTWTKDKGYKRTQNFTFRANVGSDGGMLAGQQDALDVYKIDGDKVYRRMVKIQGGSFADKLNEITRYYFDGTKAQEIIVNDTEKTNIPGDPKNENGMFYVKADPKMVDIDESKADRDARLKTYTSHMTTYDWKDKKNLANKDYKVYKAEDGSLRFTIEIDCDIKTMKTTHYDAWKEFENSTGADKDSINMRENTTIDFVVDKVDGEYKILAWRRTEKYEGAKKGMNLIKARQTSVETFSYDEADYKITDADIA